MGLIVLPFDLISQRAPWESNMITTASYGTWCNQVDNFSVNVENSVAQALGDHASDYDTTAIVRDYRAAINAALPDSITLCGNEFIGPVSATKGDFDGYPTDSYGWVDIKAVVETVDLWAIIERHAITEDTATYAGNIGVHNARWLINRFPVGVASASPGQVEISATVMRILRAYGPDLEGSITDDENGVKIWIEGIDFELTKWDASTVTPC